MKTRLWKSPSRKSPPWAPPPPWTANHTADPTGEITIVDVVEYTGLTPGEPTTISGVLMDKATGEPLLVDGAEVAAEVEFIPEESAGTVELTYTLNASTLAGATIVVFETLYSDGVEIAAHTDINDENQTVEITEPEKPTLGTTATVDGSHIADPHRGNHHCGCGGIHRPDSRRNLHHFRYPYG